VYVNKTKGDKIMALKNKDVTMFGTKIYNNETKEYGILIYTWDNTFADGDIHYATCVDINGKKYNTALDNITPVEE
jgi:hypothetical protein